MLTWLNNTLRLLNPDCTKQSSGGYTRLAFTKEEQAAMHAFISIAKSLDLDVRTDAIGNVIATYQGAKPELPPIAFGSHLDTVKNGGAYDGTAGVLAGLGVIKQLRDIGFQPDHSLEIICFIAEESARFGIATIGSKAMAGLLPIGELDHLVDEQNVSLYEALRLHGLNISDIKKMDWQEKELHSFVELHIEQGPLLESANKQIGIATGIASPLRYQLQLKGEAGHTGTTPMKKRKDALVAAARWISFIEELGADLATKDHFVATVSTAHVAPNNMNVIPESVTLGVDIRSTNEQLLEESEKLLHAFCDTVVETTGVETNLLQLAKEYPVFMDLEVTDQLIKAAEHSGKTYQYIVSGAGHDVMNMAQRWPSGLLFIPCNGVSHNPDEYTDTVNILNGIEVLVDYVKLVQKKEHFNE
ncbi:M20 family metallo-hydrolase [Virgibacillus sp. W0430]|uniref:M20 family metallo-hydrolase n=1 Tax=Virgibacillus sp. W0430 TaxID=3391580 RepID=UPI003F4857C5